MTDRIYLDNNSTTLLDPAVRKHLQLFPHQPYNPSSMHALGQEAKKLLVEAREKIARALKVPSSTLYFTSGGTESMNTLIQGLYPGKGRILSSKIEHSCVHETLLKLQKDGVLVDYVPLDLEGAPSLEAILSQIQKETSMMVFSAVYSETGGKIDLERLAQLALQHQILLVIDGVALLGKEEFSLHPGISGMGFSSHKLHGPKGVGLAYIAKDCTCHPLLVGGPQEKGMRAGTENLEGIYGFALAVELSKNSLPQATQHMEELRVVFEKTLQEHLPDISINGKGPRICNTSNIYFPEVEAETLLIALDRAGICASAGSACSSGALEPSRVLLNMGHSRKQAKSSVRFSFSRLNTKQEIEQAASTIVDVVTRLRSF